MAFRNYIIRLVANCIYFVRAKTIRESNARFIVFTGTSGKTLARNATAYALRNANCNVISPPFGYTNELGVVLAALGIESIRLLSWKGLQKILTVVPEKETYVCIELGADWYPDIPWFLKRFRPFGVCITTISEDEWTRPRAQILKEKQELLAAVLDEGFICYSNSNERFSDIQMLQMPRAQVKVFRTENKTADSFTYTQNANQYTFTSPLSTFIPHTEAFGFAVTCLLCVTGRVSFPSDLFTSYVGVPLRLSQTKLASGAALIADTYKAIPQCTAYVLSYGLARPAKKRIAVVTEMRPLWLYKRRHYEQLSILLQQFDQVYFFGPKDCSSLVLKSVPSARLIHRQSEYEAIASAILAGCDADTVIVVKGSMPYRLSKLVAFLQKG